MFCIICYGIYDYTRNNSGFYLRELTVPDNLGSSGFNALTLKAQLQEIYEEGQDYDGYDLTHERIPLPSLAEKANEMLDISFQIQGIGFSLKHIANSIGAILFGDKKRSISINLVEDSVAFKSIISISGLPVKIFKEYQENNYNCSQALQHILEKTEYYILETVSPITMANYYYEKFDYSSAMAILYRHLEVTTDPFFRDALYRVCYNSIMYDDYESTSKWLDAAIRNFPVEKYFLNLQAWQLMKRKKIREALPYLDNILKQDSIDYYANVNKGDILQAWGQTDKAILHFKKALLNNCSRVKSDELGDFFKLSSMYLRKGMADSAEKYYLDGIYLDDKSFDYTNDPTKIIWLNNSLWDKSSSVEEEWLKIHNQYPDYIPAIYALAVICKKGGQYKLAKKYLQICLSKKPDLPIARLLLGQIWYSEHKTPSEILSADSIADMLILERPSNFNALFLKAEIQEMLGNKEEAQKKYEVCLQYDRLNWDAIHNLALILFEKGNNDEIITLISKYIESYPADPLLNHFRGVLFHNKHKFRQAAYYSTIAINNKIEQYYPDMGIMAYKVAGLSNCYLQKYDLAIVQLEKYLTLLKKIGVDAENDVLYKLIDLYVQKRDFDKEKSIQAMLRSRGKTMP